MLDLLLALLPTIAVATLRKPLNVGLSEASALDAASISETVGIVYSEGEGANNVRLDYRNAQQAVSLIDFGHLFVCELTCHFILIAKPVGMPLTHFLPVCGLDLHLCAG